MSLDQDDKAPQTPSLKQAYTTAVLGLGVIAGACVISPFIPLFSGALLGGALLLDKRRDSVLRRAWNDTKDIAAVIGDDVRRRFSKGPGPR
jgi:hypothetical protein